VTKSLKRNICILSGEENVGKSTLCKRLVEYGKLRNIKISGIRSEIDIVNSQRKAINSFDIKTGEMMNLAVYSPGWDKEKPERKWRFNIEAMKWGNDVLRRALPADLLVIDEIGYLELEKGEGWNECFNLLESDKFKLALVVIRPDLLALAKKRYKNLPIYVLKEHNKKAIENELIAKLDHLPEV
jgi:nucleoside-triphosphatase THEP1